MVAATWLKKVGTTDAARMPSTRITPISWLTPSSAASFFVSFMASMPASPSKNAPVKTREKECGSELSAVAGAIVGWPSRAVPPTVTTARRDAGHRRSPPVLPRVGSAAEAPIKSRSCRRTIRGRRRSEEHTSELQSRPHLVCRLLLEKKKTTQAQHPPTKQKTSKQNAPQ